MQHIIIHKLIVYTFGNIEIYDYYTIKIIFIRQHNAHIQHKLAVLYFKYFKISPARSRMIYGRYSRRE